jgi:hypothetical protein
MKSVPFVLAVVLAGSGVARADQCQLVDSGTAVRALQLLHDHPNVLAYCEPCGDHAPGVPTRANHVATDRDRSGAYQVVIDRREVDLAYTFVQTGPERFENLAHLTGCPASGVSATLAVHAPEPQVDDAIVISPPPRAAEPPRTTYVITEHRSVSFAALLGTCLATSAACTFGLFLVLRRRRLAMRPRAIALVDRDKR